MDYQITTVLRAGLAVKHTSPFSLVAPFSGGFGGHTFGLRQFLADLFFQLNDPVAQLVRAFVVLAFGRGEHFGFQLADELLGDELSLVVDAGRPLGSPPSLDLLFDSLFDRFLNRGWRDAVLLVIGKLHLTSALRFFDRRSMLPTIAL